MKAPLIAVISVGIATAAPAVAVSADSHTTPSPAAPLSATLDAAPGAITIEKPTNQQIRHKRLVRRFLRLRNRANSLIARRDHRKRRIVSTAIQTGWSNHGLGRAIRKLTHRIAGIRAGLRARRAGLTPAVRAVLERIAYCESKGNPRAVGGGGAFRGKYQFSYGTWRAVGGRGDPAAASEAEQDRRAALLLRRSGSSPWPICG
jgi:Transglycosylase-like domain